MHDGPIPIHRAHILGQPQVQAYPLGGASLGIPGNPDAILQDGARGNITALVFACWQRASIEGLQLQAAVADLEDRLIKVAGFLIKLGQTPKDEADSATFREEAVQLLATIAKPRFQPEAQPFAGESPPEPDPVSSFASEVTRGE